MADTVIFHVDVNSAFLAWEAAYRIQTLGETEDIRTFPSVIGGDEKQRHGIVLAKSTPAKKFGITTGEPLVSARKKCPGLKTYAPNFPLYVEKSKALIALLNRYAPVVEQFSIDEAFCDFTGTTELYGSPVEFALKLKDMIREELGFTVNIGVSSNKLLAKMASDFEKPDKVHTLFPDEIREKMWPLPVSDLLYVGRSSIRTLHNLDIFTIGDLANADVEILKQHLKKHGEDMWKSANGLDDALVKDTPPANKGYGNSITVGTDVTDRETALTIILSLCETIGARLRADHAYISVVSVTIVDTSFRRSSHQVTLPSSTDITEKIYKAACELFTQLWDGEPLRLLGVHTSRATSENFVQYDMFNTSEADKLSKLNSAIDQIRNRYGDEAIKRARFIDNEHSHMTGGLSKAKRNQNKSPTDSSPQD
ncbi:MAG: DNA polymerase IV [Lachnospiraceae bacterium]|nr:DNA polymerase IV [Lachnospiraceae bacterium]